jgi:hypothetical protein
MKMNRHLYIIVGQKQLKLPVVCLLIMHIVLRIIPTGHSVPKVHHFGQEVIKLKLKLPTLRQLLPFMVQQ